MSSKSSLELANDAVKSNDIEKAIDLYKEVLNKGVSKDEKVANEQEQALTNLSDLYVREKYVNSK